MSREVELVEGEDIEWRYDRDEYVAVTKGEREEHQGRQREVLIFLSFDYVEVSTDDKGKRAFLMPEWYAIKKGLV